MTMKKDSRNSEVKYWIEKSIGNFVVKSYITSGGFGDVYKGIHKNFSNAVAIKISHAFPQQYYDILNRMFRASLKKIDVDGILNPIDFGTIDYNGEKRFYVITDFVEGAKTLKPSESVSNNDELKKRISRFCNVLHIVSKLHNYGYYDEYGRKVKGIIHGDLKPSNILIDPLGNIKIIDVLTNLEQINEEFIPDEEDNKTTFEPNTSHFGTKGFQAPEHKKGLLSEQSDIFSLGITLFVYLFCKPMEDNMRNMGQSDFMKFCRNLNSIVPQNVVNAIWKATRPEEKDRFANIEEFKTAIIAKLHFNNKAKIFVPLAILLILIVFFSVKMMISQKNNGTGNEQTEITDSSITTETNIIVKKSNLVLTCENTRGNVLLRNLRNEDTIVVGSYHALIIGCSDYQKTGFAQLNWPISDAKEIRELIINEYTFERGNVTYLENPDKDKIYDVLTNYRKKLTPSDNLLIFYAGHGYFDTISKMGYLIPSGAKKDNPAKYISFENLKDEFFSVIQSNHILLIADACQAGSVFRGEENIQASDIDNMTINMIKLKSRLALTSSNMGYTPDVSKFFRQLIIALKKNQNTVMLGQDLYYDLRNALKKENVAEPPLYGDMKCRNSEGGDFLFIRRKK